MTDPAAPAHPATGPPEARADRFARVALAVFCLVLYAWFFQGGGWNQNARLDTIRALVEQGRFEISSYASNTGDLAFAGERVYANKPPGLAVLAAPVYAGLYAAERATGLDPGRPGLVAANAWWLTWCLSGGAATGVVLLLYAWFRRRGGAPPDAFLLAAGFGAGSLLMPYSGVLMPHTLSALLIFAPWLVLQRRRPETTPWLLAGACLGLGITVDLLAVPAAVLLVAWAVARRPPPACLAALIAGLAIPIAALAIHNALLFGRPWTTPYAVQSERFRDATLWLGVFDWPRPERLYWLSVHPFRGLLYACPLFLLPIASAVVTRGRRAPEPVAEANAAARADVPAGSTALALAIVAVSLGFNLSFNGWTGGYGVGPRYLIAVTPLLFAFALPAHLAYPRLSRSVLAVSMVFMFAVAATDVMRPGPNEGPPPPVDPIAESIAAWVRGDVAQNRQGVLSRSRSNAPPGAPGSARNLGMLVGLEGRASVTPALLWMGLFPIWALRRLRGTPRDGSGDERNEGGSRERNEGEEVEEVEVVEDIEREERDASQ